MPTYTKYSIGSGNNALWKVHGIFYKNNGHNSHGVKDVKCSCFQSAVILNHWLVVSFILKGGQCTNLNIMLRSKHFDYKTGLSSLQYSSLQSVTENAD